MRVYIDTNVVLENLCDRKLAADAQQLLQAVDDGRVEGYINSCSIGNITYVAERQLKKLQISKEQRVEWLRSIVRELLMRLKVVGQNERSLMLALGYEAFTDLEDSYQYQACVSAGCECLVTINTGDFPEGDVPVVHLSAFVSDVLPTLKNHDQQ